MTLSEIYQALNKGDFNTVANEIKRLNNLYRKGDTEISDPDYDKLLKAFQHLDPENEIFKSGLIETADEINPERKEKLKYPMFSLDKLTSLDEIKKWLKNKKLPSNTILVITSKYDGISVLKNEKTALAWSRGDGTIGETMHEHYKKLGEKNSEVEFYTIGEMLVPKPVFASRTFYRDNGEPFKNARNMIAGMKNSDKVSEDLKYAKHIRYGLADDDFTKDKSEQLKFLATDLHEIPYEVISAEDLDIEFLDELFIEWGQEYDIDGLVIDIDDKDIRKKLGRETNNNPAYAKAFKNPEWSEVTEAEYRGLEWNLSKTTALKPVVLLNPFDVEGVTISRATGYNAKFIMNNNIGEGSILQVIRSGGVIPKIIGVVKTGELKLPTICPSCKTELKWNENEVDLICTNEDCDEIKFQKLAFFFIRFKIASFAEKTIKKFYDAGYDTVGKILSMTSSDIQNIEGMGNLSATKLLKEFDEKIKTVPFNVIGHASGCFENIGSRKIKMIINGIKDTDHSESYDAFYGLNKNVTEVFYLFKSCILNNKFDLVHNLLNSGDSRKELIPILCNIKGVSDSTANSFLNGISKFVNWTIKQLDGIMSQINITDEIKVVEKEATEISDMNIIDLSGRVFVFTGFRDATLKEHIEKCGGSVKDDITKATTDLLTKSEDSTSSKAKKAKANGATVTQVDVFKELLK